MEKAPLTCPGDLEVVGFALLPAPTAVDCLFTIGPKLQDSQTNQDLKNRESK